MNKISFPHYYSYPLRILAHFHYRLERYCSVYCDKYQCEMIKTKVKPKYTKTFVAINWIEYKLRPYVRAATKRAKENFINQTT